MVKSRNSGASNCCFSSSVRVAKSVYIAVGGRKASRPSSSGNMLGGFEEAAGAGLEMLGWGIATVVTAGVAPKMLERAEVVTEVALEKADAVVVVEKAEPP